MDLWVGDWVRDRNSDRIGRYEGEDYRGVILRYGDDLFIVEPSGLELIPDDQVPTYEMLFEKNKKKKNKAEKQKPFSESLDLHIEKLSPHLAGKQVELILQKQITAARKHIDEALKRRMLKIIIIHGKGSGALQMEIDHILKEYDNVLHTKRIHNGGAVEILFRY